MVLSHTLILWVHALPAFLAWSLGALILASDKGTPTHKSWGYVWIALMLFVSLSSIFIQALNPGFYTALHLLIPWTIFSIGFGIYAIRKYKKTGDERWKTAHQVLMISLYMVALFLVGVLTLFPGRMLHVMLFG